MSSTAKNRRVLIIDDNEEIHGAFAKILNPGGGRDALSLQESKLFDMAHEGVAVGTEPPATFSIDSAYQGAEGLEKVRKALHDGKPYALAFVDVRMPPGMDGVETLSRIWKEDPSVQAVICSAFSDYSWDQIAGRLGQTDRLLILKKPFDAIEARQIAFALTEKWNLAHESRVRLEQLASSQQQLQAIIDNSAAVIWLKDTSGRYMLVNRQFESLFNTTKDWITGRTDYDLFSQEQADRQQAEDQRVLDTRRPVTSEELWHGATADGGGVPADAGAGNTHQIYLCVKFPLCGPDGAAYAVCAIATDITERRAAEETRMALERKLLEAQKLESLGVLAGGIAHDFNNLLGAIMGNLGLMSVMAQSKAAAVAPAGTPALPAKADSGMATYLTNIETATRQAADLCKQLLAFSGKGGLSKQPTDLNTLIRELSHLLQPSIGPHVTFQLDLCSDLAKISADPTQLRQVVMNLIINAAEAIGQKGGSIRLKTGRGAAPASRDSGTATAGATTAGRDAGATGSAVATMSRSYLPSSAREVVVMEVSDTGAGMDELTLSRIFDPFFSTKASGRGLGLAAVIGIVRGHKAAIKVCSRLGEGTRFTILLPASAG
ncbi:MAG TPA: PAS domain-containing protein [Planctomycetota bacterium]|jgi:PAS domain S-box-containing protein